MDDLISRQAAIDAIEDINPSVAWLDYAVDIIKALPSVQPEQKKGHWINHGRYADFFPHCEYRCSECDTPYLEIEMIYNYCPNCGARMNGKVIK